MASIVDRVADLNGLTIYLTVGAFVLAEDAVFVGFFVPGETVAILGGVAASRGHASLAGLCAIVVAAAIIGDNIGYAIGGRYGERLLGTPVLVRRERRIREAQDLLHRHGGPAVFAGRFIAFLRAVTPFLAGVAHVPYRRFIVYIVCAGAIWGVGSVLLGYLLGGSYKVVERVLGPEMTAIIAGVAIVVVIAWSIRRHRRELRADDEHRGGRERAAQQDDAKSLDQGGEPDAAEAPDEAEMPDQGRQGTEADRVVHLPKPDRVAESEPAAALRRARDLARRRRSQG
jgi:membrane protein DedA with SNARE-associated domain